MTISVKKSACVLCSILMYFGHDSNLTTNKTFRLQTLNAIQRSMDSWTSKTKYFYLGSFKGGNALEKSLHGTLPNVLRVWIVLKRIDAVEGIVYLEGGKRGR